MAKVHIPFRIRRSTDGQFYFVILATNGQVLATSETYKTKYNCLKGIESARTRVNGIWGSNAIYKDETIKAVRVNN